MDWAAIHRLRLAEAFGDMQKFQAVTCDAELLAELFEWTTRGVIFIHDDDTAGHSVFVTDTRGLGGDKTFRVDNAGHTDLFLWHIDGVMYRKGSKCDCAFLTDGRLGFVEFKTNAANNTEEAIRENYEKAKSQLLQTIADVTARCDNVGVDLTETEGIPLYFDNSTEI